MRLVLLVLAVLALSMGANAKAMRTNSRKKNALQLAKTGRRLDDNQGYNNANYNDYNANEYNYNNWKNEYEGNYNQNYNGNNNYNYNNNNYNNGNYNNNNDNGDGDANDDGNQVQGGGNGGYWNEDGEWVQYEDGDSNEEANEYDNEYDYYGADDLAAEDGDEEEEYTDDNLIHYKKLLEVHDMMEFYRLVTAILAFGLFLLSLYICYLRRQVSLKNTSLSTPLAPKTPYLAAGMSKTIIA